MRRASALIMLVFLASVPVTGGVAAALDTGPPIPEPLAWGRLALIGLLLILLGVAVGVGAWRWRIAALLRRTRELEERVEERTAALQNASEELHFLAYHDELTGLANKRAFWHRADKLEVDARKTGQMFGLLLLDIDYFKKVNDEWGHRVGDQALGHLGLQLQKCSRESDLVCRYGGEEFVVLAVVDDTDVLRDMAERIRAQIESQPYDGPDSEQIVLTVSLGVAYWLGGRDNMESMFRRADKALYEAKETRNSWLMWNPAMDFTAVIDAGSVNDGN